MTTKKLALLILLSFCYFTGFSLDRSKKFELIIHPTQAIGARDLTLDIYNGYELVISRTINPNQPAPIYLNLYCNYILVIKEGDQELLKYRISTEVPAQMKKEWKMTLSISPTGLFAEIKEGNIRYQDDGRKFNLEETKSQMAEETIDAPKKPATSQMTN